MNTTIIYTREADNCLMYKITVRIYTVIGLFLIYLNYIILLAEYCIERLTRLHHTAPSRDYLSHWYGMY